MSDTWRSRAFTVDEAAAIAGFRRTNLDLWAHRQPSELFSEKRGSRRWFSPMDIAVLKLAWQLELGGMICLTAIATAFENLQEPPPPRSLLLVRNGAISMRDARVIEPGEIRCKLVDKSIQLHPIGAIAHETIAACAALHGEPA